jgi:hypothetical protein
MELDYECASEIKNDLNQVYMGTFKILANAINYNDSEKIKRLNDTIDADMVIMYHKKSPLCIVNLIFSNINTNLTFLQDNITTDNCYLVIDGYEKIEISVYLNNHYKISKIGDARSLICLKELPDHETMLALLAGEAKESGLVFDSNNKSFKLTDYSYKEIILDNFAQYDFYQIYASASSVLYILQNLKNAIFANLSEEIALLFILEIVLFQYTATCYAELLILEGLENVKFMSLKDIEKIYEKFGKTIRFWNRNNFKYLTVQNLSDKIAKSFQIQELREEYYQNLNHLEHILQLRNSQSSEREGKIINFIAIFITIIQFLPMVIEFFTTNTNWSVILIRGSIFTIPVVIILLLLNYRRSLQRRKNKYLI